MATEPGPLRGLLVDFGGVLTTNVFRAFQAFCREAGLPEDAVRDRFVADPTARELLEQLEVGHLTEPEFEPRFAAVLGVEPTGLVDRIFAAMAPEPAMVGAVRAARAAGVRTGLLSNSWGVERYDRAMLAEHFDTWVISGEVGMRKPDPRIYRIAAERMALAPEQVVFVDDLPGNLKPARALGMATLHHRSAEETVPELERLLGVGLAAR